MYFLCFLTTCTADNVTVTSYSVLNIWYQQKKQENMVLLSELIQEY